MKRNAFTLVELSKTMSKRAFTLVELLVVVAIIVVLLALLVPSMSKAIYNAALVQCGANLKGVGSGVLIYAQDFKRWYPHRPEVTSTTGRNVKPNYIGIGDQNTFADDRKTLAGYVTINKQLNDPLCEAIDIENAAPALTVEGAYNLYYGFQYGLENSNTNPGMKKKDESGMYKMGDVWSVVGPKSFSPDLPYTRRKFDLLASDQDNLSPSPSVTGGVQVLPPFAYASHPDRDRKMYQIQLENEEHPAIPGVRWTLTRWEYMPDWRRGALDNNYLHDDGSVQLIRDVECQGGSTTYGDPRLTPFPTYTDWGVGGAAYFGPAVQ